MNIFLLLSVAFKMQKNYIQKLNPCRVNELILYIRHIGFKWLSISVLNDHLNKILYYFHNFYVGVRIMWINDLT